MLSLTIEPIKAFSDNYIWAIVNRNNKTVWVVDPGDAEPVIQFITKHQYRLAGVLITHHHYDHCHGVKQLRDQFSMPVYGSSHDEVLATDVVNDGQAIFLPACDLSFKVLEIPGHTRDHLAYYCEAENLLFCGDTLFSAGCGRIFEGTPEQMYGSLMRLAALPDRTKIYCGHEYTLANLAFAKYVEPDNQDIFAHSEKVAQCRQDDKPSVPSTMALEKKINPFLRAEIPSVITMAAHYANKALSDPVSVFSAIREWKNRF